MSRYDGLIIPRSYSEYINKTDAATLQQALQLSGVLSGTVAAGDSKAVKSDAVNTALLNYQTIQEKSDANECIARQNKKELFLIRASGQNIPTSNNYVIESTVIKITTSPNIFCTQFAYYFGTSIETVENGKYYKRLGTKVNNEWNWGNWQLIQIA
jgi:hypothetical protein